MKKRILDPSGHLTLAAGDFQKSREFYGTLFGRLRFECIRNGERSSAWVTREGFGIWIKPAKHTNPSYTYFAPGIQHLCVKAEMKRQVDEIYEYMLARKASVLDKPQAYTDYTPDYYAVFFADPDGIKIEVAYY